MYAAAVRAVVSCIAAVVISAAAVMADDHCILTDDDIDYSLLKTFRVTPPAVTSERPELKFPAVTQTMIESITKTLTGIGLKEMRAAHMAVETTITTVDYNRGSFGAINVVRNGRSGPGGRQGAQVDFSEATLVVDLVREGTNALVWRGVYHDTKDTGQKLAESLPKDAAFLLAQFPPRKK